MLAITGTPLLISSLALSTSFFISLAFWGQTTKHPEAVLVYAENLIVYLYRNAVHAVSQAKSGGYGHFIGKIVFLYRVVHKLDNLIRASYMAGTAYAYVYIYHDMYFPFAYYAVEFCRIVKS